MLVPPKEHSNRFQSFSRPCTTPDDAPEQLCQCLLGEGICLEKCCQCLAKLGLRSGLRSSEEVPNLVESEIYRIESLFTGGEISRDSMTQLAGTEFRRGILPIKVQQGSDF